MTEREWAEERALSLYHYSESFGTAEIRQIVRETWDAAMDAAFDMAECAEMDRDDGD